MLGYLRKSEVGNLREFGLNLASNNICGVACNFRYSQKFEHEIGHTIKRIKSVLTRKRRPHVSVSLSNKFCSRTADVPKFCDTVFIV